MFEKDAITTLEQSMGEKIRALKPGDEVVLVRNGRPTNAAKVVKVMKQYIELTNGSKFSFDGYRRPRESGWTPTHIEPMTDRRRAELRAAKLLARVEAWVMRFRNQPSSLDVLERVAAIIGETDVVQS